MDRRLSPRAATRLAARQRTTRRQRPGARRSQQRGQTLVIFALAFTVLIGLAGLAIDVLRIYDLYSREERAAEAGALAGVIYMPTYYNTIATNIDNNSAITRALLEVQKNGFGGGVTPPSSCTDADNSAAVTVCQVTGRGTALEVTVTQNIDIFLLAAVGVQSFNVTATAGADILDPFVLGALPSTGDSNVWGDGGSSNPKNFLASINGPAEFKELGDPFVYCEDGPSYGPSSAGYPPSGVTTQQTTGADDDLVNATQDLSDSVIGSDAGFVTNHLPFTSGGPQCGTNQPDQQPPGFTGEATKNDTVHPGAYNFAIRPTSAGATVWIYNPNFSANDPQSSCQGAQNLDVFFQDDNCNNYYTTYGVQGGVPLTFDGSHFDDPRFHFDMTYSLYNVPSVLFRGTDALVTSNTYHPMDQIGADLSAHNCSGAYDLTQVSTYTNASTGQPIKTNGSHGCVTSPTSYTWQQIGTAANVGETYRLAVEATTFNPKNDPNPTCAAFQCGWGRHSYAVAVCAAGTTPSGGTCPTGGLISAWNNMDIYLNFPSAKKNVYVPVAYIPSTYAGRTVTLNLFDPGDSHGHPDNAHFLIVPPDPCIAVTYPTPIGNGSNSNNWIRTAPYGGTISPVVTGNCAQSTNSVYATSRTIGTRVSDDIYNGLWVPATFTLPSTFTGGQFWLDEYSDQGKNFDEMGVSVTLAGGSPVHLIF